MLSEERRCCLRRGDVVTKKEMLQEEMRCRLTKKDDVRDTYTRTPYLAIT
jgi:hypothetical protein